MQWEGGTSAGRERASAGKTAHRDWAAYKCTFCDTKCCVFPKTTNSPNFQHQLRVPQLNSILTLSAYN